MHDPLEQRSFTPTEAGQKVAVIGVGAVGSACAFALMLRRSCHEIVLIDKDDRRAAGVATDMRYGVPLAPGVIVRHGDYDDLAGTDVVLITAGVNEKSGGATDRKDTEGRLKLVEANAAIYRDIIPQVVEAAPEAVLVAVTDPPDPLADLARQIAGHDRVLSTGTLLDSLRFRLHVAARLGVDPTAIDAQVVGEHGVSQVLLWSTARIGGLAVRTALAMRHGDENVARICEQIEHDVRFANIAIIEGNNASQYGIGAVCARLTEAILGDERVVLPVGSYNEQYGVTLSVPTVVSKHGALARFEPDMSADEETRLEQSAATLETANRRIGVTPVA